MFWYDVLRRAGSEYYVNDRSPSTFANFRLKIFTAEKLVHIVIHVRKISNCNVSLQNDVVKVSCNFCERTLNMAWSSSFRMVLSKKKTVTATGSRFHLVALLPLVLNEKWKCKHRISSPFSQLEFMPNIKLRLRWNLCLTQILICQFPWRNCKPQASHNLQSVSTAWKQVAIASNVTNVNNSSQIKGTWLATHIFSNLVTHVDFLQ